VDKISRNFTKELAQWVNTSYIYQANYENNLPQIVERVLEYAG